MGLLATSRPPQGDTYSSLQDFPHAVEASNRVFPVAHRLLMAAGGPHSYAFVARLGRLPFAQMRHQQATSCSLTPRSHIAHRPQNRILGIAFLAISLGST